MEALGAALVSLLYGELNAVAGIARLCMEWLVVI